MAYLAVNKDESEIISDYTLYRNGLKKVTKSCFPERCEKCTKKKLFTLCKRDEDGKRYDYEHYSSPPKMDKDTAIKLLSFWDNYEYDPDGNEISFIVGLPKGSIKKLIGHEMSWEDEPIEI